MTALSGLPARSHVTGGLGDLLLPSIIFPRARWQGRRQVIAEMSAAMSLALGLDADAVLDALLERERLGATGVGEGVAIPHARLSRVDRVYGGFARLAEPADFDALDERRCDLVFMLLAPVDAGAEHLRALARVSRLFRQEAVRQSLRQAQTVDAVRAVLAPAQASDAA